MSALRQLICGPAHTAPLELSAPLEHLGDTLDFFVGQLEPTTIKKDDELSLLGPFMGRSVLELSTTALVGRLDPFRLLVLQRVQKDANYELGKRRRLSFQWQGDVVAEKPPGSGTWNDTEFSKIPRALLGAHYGETIWMPAVRRLLDSETDGRGGQWLSDLKNNTTPESFTDRYRSEIGRLYSSLSKGVHHEFVIPSVSSYDSATVTDLLRDTLRVTSVLGVVAACVSHIANPLQLDEALSLAAEVQNKELP